LWGGFKRREYPRLTERPKNKKNILKSDLRQFNLREHDRKRRKSRIIAESKSTAGQGNKLEGGSKKGQKGHGKANCLRRTRTEGNPKKEGKEAGCRRKDYFTCP